MTYTTSELRASLAKIRRQVQIKKQRVLVTHYAQPAFWLIPHRECLLHGPSVNLGEFRARFTELRDDLETNGGCIWVTFHDRPVMAVVLGDEQLIINQ